MFYLGFIVGFIFCILINKILCYIENRRTKKESERCSTQDVHVRWADTFYVEVATGKYYFASDLMKKYGRQKLGHLVAENKFVNEGHWDKMQEKKKNEKTDKQMCIVIEDRGE